MSRVGSLCGDPATLVKRNNNQLCHYMTTEPARLAKIPVLRCRNPERDNLPGPLTIGTFAKRAPGLTGSCIVTQFASERFGICRFRGSCMREYGCLPFTWTNRSVHGGQNSGLVNFVPESRLPFVQIGSIYQKTTAKAWTGYQKWLWRNGTRIFVWNIPSENFRYSVAPGNFPM